MRRYCKFLLWGLFIIPLFRMCLYHKITHMSDEELEWATNCHEGELLYFQSSKGEYDTIQISKIEIWNSLSPINKNYYQLGNADYMAGACIRFISKQYSIVPNNVINLSNIFGEETESGNLLCPEYLSIVKESNFRPICFHATFLGRRVQDNVPLKTICMQVGGMVVDDILFFDENTLESLNKGNPPNPIASFAWSKKYGLVQYTFEDGTVFTRTDLE